MYIQKGDMNARTWVDENGARAARPNMLKSSVMYRFAKNSTEAPVSCIVQNSSTSWPIVMT